VAVLGDTPRIFDGAAASFVAGFSRELAASFDWLASPGQQERAGRRQSRQKT
jgi:hypothetical protein